MDVSEGICMLKWMGSGLSIDVRCPKQNISLQHSKNHQQTGFQNHTDPGNIHTTNWCQSAGWAPPVFSLRFSPIVIVVVLFTVVIPVPGSYAGRCYYVQECVLNTAYDLVTFFTFKCLSIQFFDSLRSAIKGHLLQSIVRHRCILHGYFS